MSNQAERQIPSQEEVELIRWHKMICCCLNLLKGSLWWINESVWQQSIPSYDRCSTRKGHYGLSIRKIPPVTPYEMMPMLHGTSGEKGPVIARGLSSVKPPDYPTSFGHVAPASLDLTDFRNKKVERNTHKPKLNEQEMESLDKWMRRKGLA